MDNWPKKLPRRADDPAFDDADREAWAKLAADRTDKEVADKAGVANSTVHKWRVEWKVEKSGSVRRRRGDVATDDEKRDLALTMQAHLPKAEKVIVEAVTGGDVSPTQLRAAEIILDRGWGKPYQATPPQVLVAGDKVVEFVDAVLGS